MKPYINLNTEKRKEATMRGDMAGKDKIKLFNNPVFGKTMENLRKRINFEVVTSRNVALKRIAKPNFKRVKIFREDLIGIHMVKPVLVMNRSIQVGFTILDLSKYLMYDSHYSTRMKKFPDSTLLFTDTDSLAFVVVGYGLYAGMGEIKNELDFSKYPKDHFLQSCDNMKVVGKFKDECKGQLMLRFVGLRPKLYSFDYEREAQFDCEGEEVDKPTDTSATRLVVDNKVTAKGVKASVAKKLSLRDCEYYLNSLLPKRVDIRRIGSDLHKVSTEKVGRSAFDSKRWICDDGISTDAFGHWKTMVISRRVKLDFRSFLTMDCYICGRKYKSWQGLFYYKRKIHNCEDSSRSAVKLSEEKARKCVFCHRRLREVKMREHYLKEDRGNFTWVKCKLCCREHREEEFKEHIKQHNIYFRGKYCMKPEKLEK